MLSIAKILLLTIPSLICFFYGGALSDDLPRTFGFIWLFGAILMVLPIGTAVYYWVNETL